MVAEPGLAGVWVTADGGATAILKTRDDNSYDVTYQDKELAEGTPARYHGRLVRLGGFLFLDLRPERKAVEELTAVSPMWYLLPTHTFYRLKLEGDELSVWRVDDELVTQSTGRALAHVEVDEKSGDSGCLLTATPAEMQAQLSLRAADEAIYEKLGDFRRLK